MEPWIKILALVLPAAIILLLVSVLIFWCRRSRRRHLVSKTTPQFLETRTKSKNESLQAALAKLHLSYKSRSSSKASLRFQHLHHHHHNDHHPVVAGQQPPFKWDDHPRLISEAVENGWSRFALTSRPSLASARLTPSPLWGLCAVCDGGTQAETEWEVPLGSSEFMQTVRLNPSGDNDPTVWWSVRMALPLPGPPLGGSSFPQEAYFEITILYLQPHQQLQQQEEDDRVKLIEENSIEGQSDAVIHATEKAARGNSRIQEPGTVIKEESRGRGDSGPLVSLGLTVGGPPPTRSSPGTYSGSIGFHSNGSVYLDGMKLGLESEKTGWTEVNKVIGCGFDPGRKKVFFTVDSQLIHVIYCNSEPYRSPLYPILAASVDVMVLVNLGQSKFKYAPANAHRTPNPCFMRSASADCGATDVCYEDSRELFSMGRIDSDWLDAAKQSNSGKNGRNDGGGVAIDVDAESDLFEIALHS
uniref:Uncharacterized protein LOC105035338 n=1 Tax=Elaeis guineensis var. tenera TaxID=51953 RepID=A0A6I9QGS4_ELAGV|nr:uncharacterized protein LOC105035338 [Elaeis guineensis]XP_029117759.1 uncharacterized protein LOC105035338 [Elaeis guineensis]